MRIGRRQDGGGVAPANRRAIPHPVVAFAACFAVLAGPAAAARESIAVFRDWGAFRDTGPTRCFAIAEPPPGTRAAVAGAYAAISAWPDHRIRAQLSIRLSRGHQAGAPVTLSIGDSGFRLVASGMTAWASGRLQDAYVVAAMRSGSSMSVATVAPDGRPYADVYRLHGAASAIDAAMLACPPR